MLIGRYNTVKSNAFSSNLLSYNSSTKQVHDVPGRPQSPYDNKNLFAASPLRSQTVRGIETFIIKSNAIWNNTGKSISQIQINFADGNGFQTITIGTPKTVNYTDTGYKRWTLKITLNDNSVLQCYTDYHALVASSIASRYQTPQSTIPVWGTIFPVAGTHSGATIWVNYSNLNRTNTLRKPLIVVEGYDVSNIAPSLQPNYDISDFILAINEPRNTYDFNNQLDDIAGYDLVFVDLWDGADDIVRNAAIVQEVMNRVNANKVNDNRFGNIRQQNVVLGLSMGGLCARYALANMTKNSIATEARLLITHDSPHRGANVPLGLQYMIRMMGGVELFGTGIRDIYPDYDDAIGLLDAPATQQLLLYRATTANSFATNTFLDATYRPMVTFNTFDPQPTYRFISTANGNECANPLFNPGKTFINLGAGVSAGIYGRLLFFRVPIVTYKLAAEVEAYALPAAGSTNKIARVYTINNLKLFGFINIFRQLYNNTAYAPGTHLAIDGVPGSNYPLLDVEALNQLTNLPVFAASLYVSFPLGPFLGGYFGVYAYNAGVSYNFTFVPVGSALDVSPYNTNTFSQKYVNGTNQNYPSSSATFIAQETVQNNPSISNNTHIRFTARNSHWLFNEMEELNNTLNCSNECSNPYYIQGQNLFCTTSGNYSVPGLQRGATITWTVSPSGIVTINSPNALQTTLTRVNAGFVTLTATINNACGANPTVISKSNITVGSPKPGPISWTWNAPPNRVLLDVDDVPGATSYKWYLDGVLKATTTASYYHLPMNGNVSCGNFYYFGVRAVNGCGTSAESYVGATMPSCGFAYTVSPNPSSDNINIESSDVTDSKVNNKNSSEILEIEIIDKMGVLKQKQKFTKGMTRVNISVSILPTDVYTLRIFDGKTWHTTKIVVQH